MRSREPTSLIKKSWLLACLIFVVAFIILIVLQNHDAILVIGLHLNFKMGFIQDIENQCEEKGNPVLILRNEQLPEFPFIDDCDRSDLGTEKVIIPDPHASYREIETNSSIINHSLSIQGSYKPPSCSPHVNAKVAIIIPHRHREYHLKQLLSVLHPTLQRQKVEYSIFVIHQAGEGVFNKARLLNAGVREALKIDKTFNCFIMHDVDLVMEDERNLYYCNPNIARHISAGIDKYNYELPYDGLFGGVVALTKDQFEKINGYSNEYWGWGCEDDDMFIRVVHSCVGLEHVLHDNAHYKMIYHPHDRENSINSNRFYKLIHAKERQYTDGFSQIGNLYNVVKISHKDHMYTNITIDVGAYEKKEASASTGLAAQSDGSAGSLTAEGGAVVDPDQFEEDYAVDVSVLIVVFLLIIYSLHKSRFLVYLYKRNQRAKHYRSDRRRRNRATNSRNISNDSYTFDDGLTSDDSFSDDMTSDERPLMRGKDAFKGVKNKTHTRTQSMPTADLGKTRRK